jgi:threonine dehydrogenase-like Zn-dependent dehydrogenase
MSAHRNRCRAIDWRAAIARSAGAEVTIWICWTTVWPGRKRWEYRAIRPQGDLRERAPADTGLGFDKVVECVGGRQEQTVADAVSMVKRGGQITVVGTFPENRATIPIAYLKDREIDINFSRGNFQAFAPCLKLVATGQINPDHYISHRFPLVRAEDALRLLEARNVEAHKIVLQPQRAT